MEVKNKSKYPKLSTRFHGKPDGGKFQQNRPRKPLWGLEALDITPSQTNCHVICSYARTENIRLDMACRGLLR